MTLLEKLDAMARRYAREALEADTFVRHYEDAAQFIRALDDLPHAGMTAAELAEDMLGDKDIARYPDGRPRVRFRTVSAAATPESWRR